MRMVDYVELRGKMSPYNYPFLGLITSAIGLSSMISKLLSTSKLLVIFLKSDEVEDIILHVSTFANSAKFDGGGIEKVPIREESLKRPTPMFWRDSKGSCTNRILPVTYEL